VRLCICSPSDADMLLHCWLAERLYVCLCREPLIPTVAMGSASPEVDLLTDLLHQVPLLWSFMDKTCKKTLMATNADLRKATCNSISGISIPASQLPRNADCLLRGSGPLLQTLDLSNSNMSKAAVRQLSKGPWPVLTRPSFPVRLKRSGRHTRPNIISDLRGKFPLLKSLTICEHRLDKDEVKAMAAIDWPSLRTLSIKPSNDAMPELMKGNWPLLSHLSIEGLSDEGIQHMSSSPWCALQVLQLTNCIMGADAAMCLARAHLPDLKHLSLYKVSLLDGSEAFYELGSGGKWQALTTLELVLHVVSDVPFMDALTLGDWPALQNFTLTGRTLGNRDAIMFTQAKWPALKRITLDIMDAHHVLTQCMQKWPDLEVLCLTARLPPSLKEVMVKLFTNLALSEWPHLQLEIR